MDGEELPESAATVGRSAAERCFTGKLKEISPSEVLHFLSLSKKTGKLSLTRRDAHGLIVLRDGRIIYAASSSVRETFGNILVCRGLISEALLTEALERQTWAEEEKRLGAVLVEMGVVRREDVEEVLRHQIGVVVSELCQWTDGFFRFDTMQISEGGDIEVDAQDFVVWDGLNTDRLLLEVATRLDESSRAAHEAGVEAQSSALGVGGAGADTRPESASLSGIVAGLTAPALRGEITLKLLRFASRTLSRGVLFVVRGDEVEGVGFFGIRAGQDRMSVLSLPLFEPSVISEVIQRTESYQGRLEIGPGNDRLVEELGGLRPAEVVAIPVSVGGSVALVFYGDNAPHGRPIGSVRPLEQVLTEAGLEMEKEMLEGRIKSFERTRLRPGS